MSDKPAEEKTETREQALIKQMAELAKELTVKLDVLREEYGNKAVPLLQEYLAPMFEENPELKLVAWTHATEYDDQSYVEEMFLDIEPGNRNKRIQLRSELEYQIDHELGWILASLYGGEYIQVSREGVRF